MLACHLSSVKLLHYSTTKETHVHLGPAPGRPMWIGREITGVALVFIGANRWTDFVLMDSIAVDHNLSIREDEFGALVPHSPMSIWGSGRRSVNTRAEIRLDVPFRGSCLHVFVNADVLSAEFQALRRTWQQRRWAKVVSPLLQSLLLRELAGIVSSYSDFEDWTDEAGRLGGDSVSGFARMRHRTSDHETQDMLSSLHFCFRVK